MLTDKYKRENVKLPGLHWRAYPETKTLIPWSLSRGMRSIERRKQLSVEATEIAHNQFEKMTCSNNNPRFSTYSNHKLESTLNKRTLNVGIEIG